MKGIITGYTNALLRTRAEVEAEAAHRLAICRKCPLYRNTFGLVERCGHCGCPLSALTRQNEKTCNKWKNL